VKITYYFFVFLEKSVVTTDKTNQWLIENASSVEGLKVVSRACHHIFFNCRFQKRSRVRLE
jgi:hypothetical protein